MHATVVSVAAHPASATPPPNTHPRPPGPEGGNNPGRGEPHEQTVDNPDAVAPAALAVLKLSPSPALGAPPPIKAAGTAEVEAAAPASRCTDRASRGASGTPFLLPGNACESPPTVPPKSVEENKPGRRSSGKFRAAPGASRIRAPGWGRGAAITPIPPATNTAGAAAKAGPSLAGAHAATGTPRLHAPAPTAATVAAALPWDLLTPVTEAATAEEHSVLSHGTRETTRMTPASSGTTTTSASKPDRGREEEEEEGPRGPPVRSRCRGRRSPHSLRTNNKPRRHSAMGQGGNLLDSPAEEETGGGGGGGGGGGRPGGGCRNSGGGREKLGMWGGGTAGSGAHSAPGKSSAMLGGRPSPSAGPLSSASAYRCSPLSSAKPDRVGARGSSGSFSSASGDGAAAGRRRQRQRQAGGGDGGGGYVAAMGRRARAMARCEAARRLAAALAVEKARPSTPISERARWGKGKENQSEVERRELLRRRAEYAEELKRKAKVRKFGFERGRLRTHLHYSCVL